MYIEPGQWPEDPVDTEMTEEAMQLTKLSFSLSFEHPTIQAIHSEN